MTDTDTDTPEAQTVVKHDLTPTEFAEEVHDKFDQPEPVDYFATYASLKAGETLQVLKALGVDEVALSKTGTPQLLAVVWKHQRDTTGASKMSALLELTENELLAQLNLTEAEYVKQVTDYIESGSKS